MSKIKDDVKKQIEKRRTFAIISHPDAGKTTLTEKFLLYGGAINQHQNMQFLTGWKLRKKEVFQLLLLYCSSIMEDIVSTFWTHRDIRTSQRIHTVL